MVEYRLQGAQNAQVIHFHILPHFSREAWQILYNFSFYKARDQYKKWCVEKASLSVMLLCFKYLFYSFIMRVK